MVTAGTLGPGRADPTGTGGATRPSDATGPSVAPAGATAALAAFAAGLEAPSLPGPVLHQARRLLLDTVGCILGGHATHAGRYAVAWATATGERTGGRPGVPVVGGGPTLLAPALAAYANGRLAAVLDADETWPSTRQVSHLAAATVAAALAASAARDATLGELLASIAAGYEAGARVSDSMLPAGDAASGALRPGWGPGSPVAAAVAAGRAGRLDPARMAHAVGIAASHVDPAPLQWAEVRPAPMAKSADAGWHALTGVAAAEMAGLGMTGYDGILDGDRGLWRALGYAGCDPDALLAGLGQRWRILDAAFKRWPAQYWMHPALTALASIVERHAPDPAAIEAIRIETNEKSFSAKFHDPSPPGEIDRAFSFPHAAAMLVLGIEPGPRWLDDGIDLDPRVLRLRPLVSVLLHPDAGRIGEWVVDHGFRDLPARVTVSLHGGELAADARLGRGAPWSPETRLDDDALGAKARQLATAHMAGPEGAARIEGAFDWIRGADPGRPVRELTSAIAVLTAEPGRTFQVEEP